MPMSRPPSDGASAAPEGCTNSSATCTRRSTPRTISSFRIGTKNRSPRDGGQGGSSARQGGQLPEPVEHVRGIDAVVLVVHAPDVDPLHGGQPASQLASHEAEVAASIR